MKFFLFFLITIVFLKIIIRLVFSNFVNKHYLNLKIIQNQYLYLDVESIFLDFKYFYDIKNIKLVFKNKSKLFLNRFNYKTNTFSLNKNVLLNFDLFKLNYCLANFFLIKFALQNKGLFIKFKIFLFFFLCLNYFLNVFLLANIIVIILINNLTIVKILNFTSCFLIFS